MEASSFVLAVISRDICDVYKLRIATSIYGMYIIFVNINARKLGKPCWQRWNMTAKSCKDSLEFLEISCDRFK